MWFLALAACGPRAWAERVVALDADSALVVTSGQELGVIGPGARWLATLDLRGHDVVPASLSWNGTAAVSTTEGTVVWNPADGHWTDACCGGEHARIAAGQGMFLSWEDGRDGTVALAPSRPAWRHPLGKQGRVVLGAVAVLAGADRVAVVRLADGIEVASLDGALRCALGDRVLVSTATGLLSVDVAGTTSLVGPWSAPGGCVARGQRIVLFDGAPSGPAEQLVEVPGGRTLAVGAFVSHGLSGPDAPRYLAALRTEAGGNRWIALDLDDWRSVDGPATTLRSTQIGLGRAAATSFGWCGEDVVVLDGQRGLWHLGAVRGWAGDAAAIAGGVAWTRTYDRVEISELRALSWGARVSARRPGAEPFPGCLGVSEP